MKKNKKTDIKYIYYYLGAHMRNNVIDFQPKEIKTLEMLWMFICLEKISQVKIQQQLI